MSHALVILYNDLLFKPMKMLEFQFMSSQGDENTLFYNTHCIHVFVCKSANKIRLGMSIF